MNSFNFLTSAECKTLEAHGWDVISLWSARKGRERIYKWTDGHFTLIFPTGKIFKGIECADTRSADALEDLIGKECSAK